MPTERRLLTRNKYLFYGVTFLEFAFFNDAIFILFGHQYLHLDYFQAGSLFFVGGFVSIALDFWGGVIADRFGRKRTALYGFSLQCLSYAPFLFSKSFPLLILASIIWGIGMSLSSNTLHALIYEQTVSLKGKNSYAHISATSQIWLFLGVGLATAAGGFAYKVDPRFPYALTMLTLLIAVVLTLCIQVPKHVERALVTDDAHPGIARAGLSIFRHNKPLRNFVIISFWAGLFGDLLFAYYQPYYIELKVSAVTLGLLFGGLRLASAFGSYLMRRLSDTTGPATIQLFNITAMLLTTGLMFVLRLPLVLLAPLFLGVSSGFVEPNMRLYINKHASNSVRASAISFGTAVMNFGVTLGFAAAFYLADTVPVRTVLSIIIVGCLATLLLRVYYSGQASQARIKAVVAE